MTAPPFLPALADAGSTAGPGAWLWLVGVAGVALAVDLVLAVRRHRDGMRAAAIQTVAWTVVGLGFLAVVAWLRGGEAASSYLTVFLLEKSLSIDNVGVFAVVLATFAIPAAQRARVLAGGIVAALVLRLAFVAGGLAVVDAAHAVLVVFGVVLVVAGARMALHRGGSEDRPPRAAEWLRRRHVAPAAAALATLALTDLVFAVDSVPAAFAVTRDGYVVAAANAFSVLGMRPAYTLLVGALDRLRHLATALGVLLALIGVALVVGPWWHAPEWALLVAIVVTLGAGVLLSLVSPRRVVVSAGGLVVVAAGIAMLVLPGPGLVVIAAGLALLATEYAWARRMHERTTARATAAVARRLPRRRSVRDEP